MNAIDTPTLNYTNTTLLCYALQIKSATSFFMEPRRTLFSPLLQTYIVLLLYLNECFCPKRSTAENILPGCLWEFLQQPSGKLLYNTNSISKKEGNNFCFFSKVDPPFLKCSLCSYNQMGLEIQFLKVLPLPNSIGKLKF